MRKILAVVVVLFIIGIVIFSISKNGNDKDQPSNSTADTNQKTEITNTTTPTQGQSAVDQSAPEASQSNTILITNSSYSPASLTVRTGTTVTWTNNDDLEHDVAPDEPSDEFRRSALLRKGGTYSVTFDTPGTYTYHCTPHPFMKGTIVVTE